MGKKLRFLVGLLYPIVVIIFVACQSSRVLTPADLTVLTSLNSIISATKNFDTRGLEAWISQDYGDSQGRNRLELLNSLRNDQENFVNVETHAVNTYAQPQNGNTFLRFDFSWKAVRKIGPDKRFRGRAEWIFRQENGILRLLSARGDPFIGRP